MVQWPLKRSVCSLDNLLSLPAAQESDQSVISSEPTEQRPTVKQGMGSFDDGREDTKMTL